MVYILGASICPKSNCAPCKNMAQSEAISKIRHKKKAAKKRLYIFFKKKLFGCEHGNFSVRSVPLYSSVNEGEEGVIPSHSDVLSGVDFRAALAEYYVASQNVFVAVFLDAATLRVGIAPVS